MASETQGDIVWRYGNRKLYDTRRSRYVTFEILKDYVLEGAQFTVQNRTTGTDETLAVLCQVLHHQLKNGATLPAKEIKALIKSAETSTQEKSDGVTVLEGSLETRG